MCPSQKKKEKNEKERANHLLCWSGRRRVTPADHYFPGTGGMDHLDGTSHVPGSLRSPRVRR